MVVSLDDLKEQCGSIFDGFGEDLQKVSLVIIVDEDLKLLEGCNIFLHLNSSMFKSLSKSLVIGVRDSQELDTSVRKSLDSLNDIIGVEGNMLNSSTSVVFNVLLDL